MKNKWFFLLFCGLALLAAGTAWGRQQVFIQPLSRVAVHELAHTFGLQHCPRPGCLMEDARGTIRTVDSSNGLFCAACQKQLGSLLKKR